MKVRKQDVPRQLLKAFPNYRGRKFHVNVTSTVTFSDTEWGGGTRNSFVAVNMATGAVVPARQAVPEGVRADLPPNVVVVEHAMFCGKDCGLTFHVHPDNAVARLEERS